MNTEAVAAATEISRAAPSAEFSPLDPARQALLLRLEVRKLQNEVRDLRGQLRGSITGAVSLVNVLVQLLERRGVVPEGAVAAEIRDGLSLLGADPELSGTTSAVMLADLADVLENRHGDEAE